MSNFNLKSVIEGFNKKILGSSPINVDEIGQGLYDILAVGEDGIKEIMDINVKKEYIQPENRLESGMKLIRIKRK